MNMRGFTLIEIMIALVLFAIMASITGSSIYYAFDTRKRLTVKADIIYHIELTTSLLKQDTLQAITRTTLGNEMHVFPAFIGQMRYMEFTRDGLLNPDAFEQKSSLLRVAYLCNKDQLIRRYWSQVDTPNRALYFDKMLLDKLEDCAFSYVNKNRQLVTEWQEDASDIQPKSFMPIAIKVRLKLPSSGEVSLLLPLPEALYAT